MSRYSLKVRQPKWEQGVRELIVGYDVPCGGFFFQVFGEPDEEGEDTFIEPWEMSSSRHKILRIMEEYADFNNELSNIIRHALSIDVDPEQTIGTNYKHWVSYFKETNNNRTEDAKKES